MARKSTRYCLQCLVAGSSEKPLKTCARCKQGHYCSPDCQKKHWKTHKAVCEICEITHSDIKAADDPINGVPLSQYDKALKEWILLPSIKDACYKLCVDRFHINPDRPGLKRIEEILIVKVSVEVEEVPGKKKRLTRFAINSSSTIPIGDLGKIIPSIGGIPYPEAVLPSLLVDRERTRKAGGERILMLVVVPSLGLLSVNTLVF